MRSRRRVRTVVVLAAAGALLACAGQALARVKLATLPVRERVEIQLDNLQATLVEEERIVPLLEGSNQVDFSWSSTAIEKGTIQFRVIGMPVRDRQKGDPATTLRPDGKVEQIRVVSVSYPPNENALVWDVWADRPFAARIRISYLIDNLKQSFSYRAVAEHDESTLTLRCFLRLDNFSGEDFGTSGVWAGFGKYFHSQVGLDEAKELLVCRFDKVPITKTLTFDWWTGQHVADDPEQRYVEMRYVLQNDAAHGLGQFPFQAGKARIFQKDGHGGEAFIGEDWGRFTPIDDRMKLYLGLSRDIVVRRRVMQNLRHGVQGNLHNQEITVRYTMENFKSTAAVLDIREDMGRLRDEFCGARGHDPQWEIVREGTSLAPGQMDRQDVRTLELHVPLAAAPQGGAKVEAVTVTLHLLFKNEF